MAMAKGRPWFSTHISKIAALTASARNVRGRVFRGLPDHRPPASSSCSPACLSIIRTRIRLLLHLLLRTRQVSGCSFLRGLRWWRGFEPSDKLAPSCGARNAGHGVLALLQELVLAQWKTTASAREEATAITESKPPADRRWRDFLRPNGIFGGRPLGRRSVRVSRRQGGSAIACMRRTPPQQATQQRTAHRQGTISQSFSHASIYWSKHNLEGV